MSRKTKRLLLRTVSWRATKCLPFLLLPFSALLAETWLELRILENSYLAAQSTRCLLYTSDAADE